MAKITEVKNLTKSKSITDQAELDKFGDVTGFTDKLTSATATAATWADFAAADNIEVTWKDGDKVVARGVGGTYSLNDKTVTITGLANASKFTIGVNGEIAIGPKAGNAAAIVRVNMTNAVSEQNPKGDTIIDFSDKTNNAEGSVINLADLLVWLKDNTGTSDDVKVPDVKDTAGNPVKAESFQIQFKNFYFNITQRTFDFWVVSKAGQSIQFGNFTISNVGFRITNIAAPVAAALPAVKA